MTVLRKRRDLDPLDVEPLVSVMANNDSGIRFVLGILKKAKRGIRRGISETQSVLFDKLKWTKDAAAQWLRDHGFLAGKADSAATFWRFRQTSPRKYRELRTITPGVRQNPTSSGRFGHKYYRSLLGGGDVERYATGARMAEYHPLHKQWAAQSQYGHALSWHATEADALVAAKAYYATRPHLLEQENPATLRQLTLVEHHGQDDGDNHKGTYPPSFSAMATGFKKMLEHLAVDLKDERGKISAKDRESYKQVYYRAFQQGAYRSKMGMMAHSSLRPGGEASRVNPGLGSGGHYTGRGRYGGTETRISAPLEIAVPFPADTAIDHGLVLVHDMTGAERNWLHEASVKGGEPEKYLQDAGYHREYGWRDGTGVQWRLWRKEYPLSVARWNEDLGRVENPTHRYARRKSSSGWDIVDVETGEVVRTVKTASAAIQVVASMNAKAARPGRQGNPDSRIVRAKKYVKAIHNLRKKRYAQAYLDYMIRGFGQPPGPEPEHEGLSTMAAQAVRMNIHDIFIMGGRQNPESAAASLYEEFHGRPPDEIVETRTEVQEHDWLTTLGALRQIKVYTVTGLDATIDFEEKGAPDLCSNENGTQLFIEDGDQSLPLGKLGMGGDKWKRESIVIGSIQELTYETQKQFDGFKTTQYYHRFADPREPDGKDGDLPTLVYDTVNELLAISGGTYKIAAPGVLG